MPPSTTPPPPNLLPSHSHLGRLAVALTALVLLAAVTFVVVWMTPHFTGSVRVLVRDSSTGMRAVYDYSLKTETLTKVPDANPALIETSSAKLYQQPDGSVIGLTPGGVAMADIKNRTTLLIASPVPPTLRTPFTVWGGGERIAWMSPADGSIQVFARTDRGTYQPVVLNSSLTPNSLGFTDDGATLVVGRYVLNATEIYGMKVPGGTLTKIGTIPGVATIISKP